METGALRLSNQRPLLASSTNPRSGYGGKEEPALTVPWSQDRFWGAARGPPVSPCPFVSLVCNSGQSDVRAWAPGSDCLHSEPRPAPSWLCELEQDSRAPEPSSARWL